MEMKKIKLPTAIIAVGLIVAFIACLLTCITKEPTIKENDFNYSATYRIGSETKTIEGVYRVVFKSTGGGIDPLERYYEGYYPCDPLAGEPEYHTLARQGDLELAVVFIFTDDFLMGDGDREEEYEESVVEPYLAVYDKEGYEYSDSEMLEKFDAELISWELPEPIENSFVFSGFSLMHHTSMLVMCLAGILVLIACVIFVKKDSTLSYKPLDKLSTILNFLVGIVAFPFITLVVSLLPITMSGEEFTYQLFLCIPPFILFTIAASVALRRRGFTKSGLIVQLTGPAFFAVYVVLESIIYNIF